MKKIYAIIVTYNALHKRWIDRCLNSLQESTIEIKPIIIDNGSTDGTREYVPLQYPDTIWLPQNENLGFGKANNIGMRYAINHHATHVLLLNQDAALHPKALEYMLAADDGESLLSPLHLNGDGTDFDQSFRMYSLPSETILKDVIINGTMPEVYITGEICAACWLMPVGLINKIGGFNPVFTHYGEDNNYYDRMLYHGIKTKLIPKAKMYHDRQFRGNVKAYNHKMLRRLFIIIAYDINNSFTKCVRSFLGKLKSCYLKELCRGQYIPGHFTYEVIRLIANIGRIRQSRKQEKKLLNNWL